MCPYGWNSQKLSRNCLLLLYIKKKGLQLIKRNYIEQYGVCLLSLNVQNKRHLPLTFNFLHVSAFKTLIKLTGST